MLQAGNSLAAFPSRHNIIDVEIDLQMAKPPVLNGFIYRDFKSTKTEKLLSLLAAWYWSPVSCPNSGADVRLEHLSQTIMIVIDKLAPLKEFKPRKRGIPPWVDAEIKDIYRR